MNVRGVIIINDYCCEVLDFIHYDVVWVPRGCLWRIFHAKAFHVFLILCRIKKESGFRGAQKRGKWFWAIAVTPSNLNIRTK